ncbi:MAG: iron ABC transporter permease [Bacteroidetes bacterium]|nr:iron ABC transporter permease [Bacteroidota bacterium]
MKKHFLILLAVLVVVLLADLLWGATGIAFRDFINVLISKEPANSTYFIIWKYRIPKMLTALFAGAGLAISGLLMQTLFRNPLAGPYVLGISSGASLGVSLVILGASFLSPVAADFFRNDIGTGLSALGGTFLVLALMIWVAGRVGGNFTILIMGLIVGQILGALQGVTNFLANPETLKEFVLWGLGSFNQTNMNQILLMSAVILPVVLFAYFYSGKLNAYLLGDLYAKSLGIDLTKFRRTVIILAGLTAGIITAFCGPIAFVGMAVPHLARHLLKTYNHALLIPSTALLGAILALVCDLISHVLLEGYVIPINVISAILGGPVVVWVVFKQRNKMYEN